MSRPVLFATPGSCSLACIVALEWRGEPYTLLRVDAEQRKSAAYARINPRLQVPAMMLDGQVLVEANAILTHISDNAPAKQLLPGSGWSRDFANQILAYFASGFHAAFWPYFHPERYTTDAAHHTSVTQAAINAVRRELATMDAHLATREFVLGEQRSLLDPYLHAMDRWANALVDMPSEYPHVFRHQTQMSKEPAVRIALGFERALAAPPAGSVCVEHKVFAAE